MAFQRFIEFCAGRTGQLLNYSSLAADIGVTQPTAKAWLSVLEASFVVFRLPAFHSNRRRRLAKMPKLHFYDTGLACWLLGIRSADQLRSHPLRGAIFESWVVSEVVKHRTNLGETGSGSFYRDRDGVEADLVLELADRLVVVEAKAAATPSGSLVGGAERVRAHLSEEGRPVDTIVVYGGDDVVQRTHTRLVPWHSLHQEAWIAPLR